LCGNSLIVKKPPFTSTLFFVCYFLFSSPLCFALAPGTLTDSVEDLISKIEYSPLKAYQTMKMLLSLPVTETHDLVIAGYYGKNLKDNPVTAAAWDEIYTRPDLVTEAGEDVLQIEDRVQERLASSPYKEARLLFAEKWFSKLGALERQFRNYQLVIANLTGILERLNQDMTRLRQHPDQIQDELNAVKKMVYACIEHCASGHLSRTDEEGLKKSINLIRKLYFAVGGIRISNETILQITEELHSHLQITSSQDWDPSLTPWGRTFRNSFSTGRSIQYYQMRITKYGDGFVPLMQEYYEHASSKEKARILEWQYFSGRHDPNPRFSDREILDATELLLSQISGLLTDFNVEAFVTLTRILDDMYKKAQTSNNTVIQTRISGISDRFLKNPDFWPSYLFSILIFNRENPGVSEWSMKNRPDNYAKKVLNLRTRMLRKRLKHPQLKGIHILNFLNTGCFLPVPFTLPVGGNAQPLTDPLLQNMPSSGMFTSYDCYECLKNFRDTRRFLPVLRTPPARSA
ncbi:MAG: hypothetical protein JW774_00635, partial [Candidatus Aureabacteria bacterium]|nr:hypothetical protein [Candidatus Auribacterota bacterium]